MSILDCIDATLDGCCPCGGTPRPGSPYCSYDCEPTPAALDGDYHPPTAMRWRPELVNGSDDTNLIRFAIPGHTPPSYTGRYNASIYRYAGRDVWHLRLDNGHRYVGLDITEDEVYNAPNLTTLLQDMWARLERELDNTRHLEPCDDPWADSHPTAVALRAELTRHQRDWAAPLDRWVAEQLNTATPRPQPSHHNPQWRPLVNSRDAAILTDHGLRQHEHFEVYPDRIEPDPGTETTDEPPADPMERALWLRRNRNTGPAAPRLDGRRRSRR